MRKGMTSLEIEPPTPDQLALIRRFITAFNAIEAYLREIIRDEGHPRFTDLVSKYEQLYPAWRMGAAFRDFAVVRNGLVHNETNRDRYLSVPLAPVVKEIERQRKLLIEGQHVGSRFKHNVKTVTSQSLLSEALTLMQAQGYSQLPVYDGRQFKGLLTENGITRWLARTVAARGLSFDLTNTLVSSALRQAENSRKVEFVSSTQTTIEVLSMFIRDPLLEAVLITQTGKHTEKPLGLVTAWDVARVD
jgi:CBS domain-containing protein